MYLQALGESCLLAQIDAEPSPQLVRQLAAAARQLRDEVAVRDAVPAYTSIAVYFDPDTQAGADIGVLIREALAANASAADAPMRRHRIAVHYDGVDLDFVARSHGLDPAAVVRAHTAPVYTVAMIGFRPHFAYLLGLDPAIATPRRAAPRSCIPAGSVAIGGGQTAIYPSDAPAGWHIIGRTDPAVCRSLEPGDELCFEAVRS